MPAPGRLLNIHPPATRRARESHRAACEAGIFQDQSNPRRSGHPPAPSRSGNIHPPRRVPRAARAPSAGGRAKPAHSFESPRTPARMADPHRSARAAPPSPRASHPSQPAPATPRHSSHAQCAESIPARPASAVMSPPSSPFFTCQDRQLFAHAPQHPSPQPRLIKNRHAIRPYPWQPPPPPQPPSPHLFHNRSSRRSSLSNSRRITRPTRCFARYTDAKLTPSAAETCAAGSPSTT
jgi:hypothetical protein